MFDSRLRAVAGRSLDRVGADLAARGVSAAAVTLAGFAAGGRGVLALAVQHDGAALALILVNRALDGLDGAVARHHGATDFGGFLDIVSDFLLLLLQVLDALDQIFQLIGGDCLGHRPPAFTLS